MAKRKTKSSIWGILIYILVALASWLAIGGAIEIIEQKGILLNPMYKLVAGLVALVIITLLGWRKFR